jgi:glycosyltransferase involved in cell wall biosynthesis
MPDLHSSHDQQAPTIGDGELRVALSMLSLVPGGMGGSETYAHQLALGLEARRDVDVIVALPRNAAGFSGVRQEVPVRSVTARPSSLGRLRAVAASIISGSRIRAALRSSHVVHFPFSLRAPRAARSQATVVTIHDLQHRDLPQFFSLAERAFRALAYERPARHADLVITISEFAREGIETHLGIDPSRIRVIPLGVDTAAFQPNRGARENFVLYPARAWPHKNHARLVEAVRILRATRPDLRLVLTGGNLDALGDLPNWVERRGLVSDDELHDLYRRAAALGFPSLYEGFGLPLLEAMASGCPVAASDAASIPEVCGDAAELFDPENPIDIARAIDDAISNRELLAQRGLVRIASLGWERCVEGHVAAYREAQALHREGRVLSSSGRSTHTTLDDESTTRRSGK